MATVLCTGGRFAAWNQGIYLIWFFFFFVILSWIYGGLLDYAPFRLLSQTTRIVSQFLSFWISTMTENKCSSYTRVKANWVSIEPNISEENICYLE
jgi:hypothetical protein